METNLNNELDFLGGRSFESDITTGEIGENVFIKWCNQKGFQIRDFRKDHVDFDFGIRKKSDLPLNQGWTFVDVKRNYDGYNVYLETHRTYPVENGWYNKSRCNEFVLINKKNDTEMIFIHNNKDFHNYIDFLIEVGRIEVTINDKTYSKSGKSWTSAFIKVPLNDIEPLFYRKIKLNDNRFSSSRIDDILD